MKFIQFIAIITICVKIAVASPLMQLIDNEDEILAKDIISISNESKSASDESSSDESHENATTESILETHLYPLSPSAISQVPFLQDELKENFSILNGTQPTITQSYGLLSAFNLPWLAGISFHKQSAVEHEIIGDLKLTVSGEFFETTEEINTTTKLNLVTQRVNETTSQNSTTTITTTPPTTIISPIGTTKISSESSTTNATTTVVSTTEAIKEKLIEKIAEVAAEPIILTQGVR